MKNIRNHIGNIHNQDQDNYQNPYTCIRWVYLNHIQNIRTLLDNNGDTTVFVFVLVFATNYSTMAFPNYSTRGKLV